MKSIIDQNLVDKDFVNNRTKDFKKLKEHLEDYSPEKMSKICGISPSQINEIARIYASAPASIIFWGMGISQHIHGTDNARALISLSLMTGQIGRPGTGLHPLRGQNNVQGSCDMGALPNVYTNYQSVSDPENRAAFSKVWGVEAPAEPGLTYPEMLRQVESGNVRSLYLIGSDIAHTDPDNLAVIKALSGLDLLIVQDNRKTLDLV